MRPMEVDDRQLERGIDTLDYVPNASLPFTDAMLRAAHKIFYTDDLNRFLYTPRITLDQAMAQRHIQAVKASKISPKAKVEAIARLLTLWYYNVTPQGESSDG